jgi:signal transduction histidine kinase/DNA-binding NarL/FixJ family response regulator
MDDRVSVEEVLCTDELQRRPSRAPDFATESRAIGTLVQALADSPDNVLQTMAEIMLEAFKVGSAGCSVLDGKSGDARLYWPAIAGAWKAHIGGGTPRGFGPCGEVLDRNIPLLFKQPQRRYAYLRDVTPGVEECLLVAFYVDGNAAGTVWLVTHDANRKFDREDLRQLQSISKFASSAYQVATFSQRMRGMNEALLLGSLHQREFAEAEEKLNELLRVEITHRKMLEMELTQATERANQASISKSDFLANMSHELRTPLSAILGHAQVMECSGVLTDAQKRSVTQIKKGGWYLADLINEILDLAQIEAGKLSVSLQVVALSEILLECQALIEPLAKPLAITVLFPCTESAAYVVGDRKRIKQVLINLLSNAIKYNKRAGTVTVECGFDIPERVRISVTDTGEGLSGAQLSQLFQLFNRLGRDELKVSGTGIGLVMTKRLTELMGGTVGAESTVGTGSTFWVELTRASPPGVIAVRPPRQEAPTLAANRASKTLLYIEDNSANLIMVQDLMLQRHDIRLLSAEDGNRGLAMARANLPDAILLDMRLPDISGMQVQALLSANPETARIPVIAFSANAMPQDISQALDAGFFHYLTKPVDVGEFMETLDKALEGRGILHDANTKPHREPSEASEQLDGHDASDDVESEKSAHYEAMFEDGPPMPARTIKHIDEFKRTTL